MSFNPSTAKENEEPVHIVSNAESAVLTETLDAENPGDEAAAGDIKAADEVTGIKLALIIVALCFSNILTGLVSRRALVHRTTSLIHMLPRTSR